jgi:putative flippase GtrA
LNVTQDTESPIFTISKPKKGVAPRWNKTLTQILRFGLVGGLSTTLDLLVLNLLLWLRQTTNPWITILYTILAYGVGSINTFLCNKYWTFQRKQRTTWKELGRFATTILTGLSWNLALIWLASMIPHPFIKDQVLWTNAAKLVAIASAAFISFLGMRLWVFVRPATQKDTSMNNYDTTTHTTQHSESFLNQDAYPVERRYVGEEPAKPITQHGLSIVLPAYNEEQVIASTIQDVLTTVSTWKIDFEIIVVNDGSSDRTAAIVSQITGLVPQVRLINHSSNRGYGAALMSGFAAASKDLTFFMDSDGQFLIEDLRRFFTYIDAYDAVIGYRIVRRDHWMRKLNAWGWNRLVSLTLGVSVHDLDCAFKLLHTNFLQQYALETGGAMVNAELLYKLKLAGGTYKEMGVRHLPRRAGQATGANPKVILRAFRDLLTYTAKWRREEQQYRKQHGNRNIQAHSIP